MFVVHSEDKIIPDKNEVDEVREISLHDLKCEVAKNPEHFFDAFLMAIKKYFEKSGL